MGEEISAPNQTDVLHRLLILVREMNERIQGLQGMVVGLSATLVQREPAFLAQLVEMKEVSSAAKPATAVVREEQWETYLRDTMTALERAATQAS